MSAHRGGRKRPHKRKGHQPQSKSFKEYCRHQRLSGLTNSASGQWVRPAYDLRSKALYDGTH